MRNALGRLFRAQGIPHRLYASTEALIDGQWDNPFVCVLLDINLPAATGLELQHILGKLDLPWPIVFMTEYGTIPMTVQAMRAGTVESLTQPFDEQSLLELLDSVRSPPRFTRKIS